VTTSQINGTSLIGDIVLMDPIESEDWESTVAALSFLMAGEEDLRGKLNIRPGSVTKDLHSI